MSQNLGGENLLHWPADPLLQPASAETLHVNSVNVLSLPTADFSPNSLPCQESSLKVEPSFLVCPSKALQQLNLKKN